MHEGGSRSRGLALQNLGVLKHCWLEVAEAGTDCAVPSGKGQHFSWWVTVLFHPNRYYTPVSDGATVSSPLDPTHLRLGLVWGRIIALSAVKGWIFRVFLCLVLTLFVS